MEASFLELRSKQVINTVDGKCLGRITDIIFDVGSACVLGFVVPPQNCGFWGMFKGGKDIFIPYECVLKIGVDAILVELYMEEEKHNKKNPKDCGKDKCKPQNNGNFNPR